MPQTTADKPVFSFIGGLYTEASELNQPENTAQTLENFELKIDGSLKRRRGTEPDTQGTVTRTGVADVAVNYHIWEDVEGGRTLFVQQSGANLVIYEDAIDLGAQIASFYLGGQTKTTVAALAQSPFSFASGDGRMFVSSEFMETLVFEISGAGAPFLADLVFPKIREYRDVADGIAVGVQPSASIPTSHNYNLRSRGWKAADITAFFGAEAEYPSKAMDWRFGLRRDSAATAGTPTNIYQDDWSYAWDTDRINAFRWGNSSAPTGHLLVSLYDQSYGYEANTGVLIASYTVVGTGTVWTVDVTTSSAHGLIPTDEFYLTDSSLEYKETVGSEPITISLDGNYIAQATTAGTTIRLLFDAPTNGFNSITNTIRAGSIVTDYEERTGGDDIQTDARARCNAFFAGRLCLSGIRHPDLQDKLYFSQIVLNKLQSEWCYQQNDPTAQNFNELLSSDGGYVQVPGMGFCHELIALESVLLMFAENGVWQISGGQGYFAANDIAIRKITDVGAISNIGVRRTDAGVMYTAREGIYLISTDGDTQQLESRSVTETTIQSFWNDIDDARQDGVQAVWDSTVKRAYFIYGDDADSTDANERCRILTYDFRLNAWYTWRFDPAKQLAATVGEKRAIAGLAVVKAGDGANLNTRLKFLVNNIQDNGSGLELTIGEVFKFRVDDYEDTSSGTNPIPQIITSYDNVGDWQHFRQAPYIMTYMRRSETGFSGDTPINESGLLMQARWDWADSQVANKWGTPQQVYRHRRQLVVSGTTFDDGTPVVVAKNKVRGRGRSLHLQFIGEDSKDAQLLGWAIQYRGSRRL